MVMNVAVLGAAAAGRDIAQVCALGGDEVSLHASDATDVMDAIDVIERRLADAIEAGRVTADAKAATIDRLEATTGLEAAVSAADVVIDTATDDVGALQRRFANIEEHVGREALITTSQSALSVTAAAAGLRHPDRALGLHFHRPLDGALVEIVVTEHTAETATERAESFLAGIETTAVIVRDTPGLASTRLALALEVEAMRLVADGVAGVEAVDTALTRGYDHPTGPLEQADSAGLDDRLAVLEQLAETLGERYRPPELLADRVAAGKTGADTGEGFYLWEDGEPTESALPDPDLAGESLPDDPARK